MATQPQGENQSRQAGGIIVSKQDLIKIWTNFVHPVAVAAAILLSTGSLYQSAKLTTDPAARPGAHTAEMDANAMEQQRQVFTAQIESLKEINREMIASLRREVAQISASLGGMREDLGKLTRMTGGYYHDMTPNVEAILRELRRNNGEE